MHPNDCKNDKYKYICLIYSRIVRLYNKIFHLPFLSLFRHFWCCPRFWHAPEALGNEGPGTGSLTSDIVKAWISFPVLDYIFKLFAFYSLFHNPNPNPNIFISILILPFSFSFLFLFRYLLLGFENEAKELKYFIKKFNYKQMCLLYDYYVIPCSFVDGHIALNAASSR